MAGIFGLLDFSGRTDIRAAAEKLRAAAKQNFGFPSAIREFRNGAIGFAFPNHYSDTKWPLNSADGKLSLVVFGEIFLPNGEPVRSHNFETGLLEPYLREGKAFLQKLDGAFIFALMSEEICVVVNDASGNFGLHYSTGEGHFAFSTQMMSLLPFTSEQGFDERGLFEHLAISQSLDGRTSMRSVQRLPRGSILTYSREGAKLEEYISREFHPSADVKTELIIVYDALAHSVVQSARHERTTAALTGGFDSRMTWSLVMKCHRESSVAAETFGLPGSRDMRLSKHIANTLHLTRDAIDIDTDVLQQLPVLWREFASVTEGLYPISQVHAHYALRVLGEKYSVLIDSYGGALYRRQIKKFVEPRIRFDKELAPQVLPFELTALVTSTLIRPDVRETMKAIALQGLREYYARIEDVPEIGDKFDLYYADQTVALRDAFSANHQMNFIGLSQPLMNATALAAVRRIHGKIRRREGIHTYIIHRAYPKLETFSLDYSGYVAPYRGFSTLRLVAPGFDRMLRAASRILPALKNTSLRKPPMDARSILEPGLALAKDLLLTPHPSYDPLIDRAAIERTLHLMEAGDYSSASAIIQLLTFRLFLDVFV